MKKIFLILFLFITIRSSAQFPIAEIIKAGITKIIKAVDLKIQKLQNKTLALQNLEKQAENIMSKTKLGEIRDWTEKQKKLYADYFDELKKVKKVISYYKRVRDIIDQQIAIIGEYKSAWQVFKSDKNFNPEELDYIKEIYSGILSESSKNIDQLFLVINAFQTSMTDAKRLSIINEVADNTRQNLVDLRQFNDENKMLSLQRTTERVDIDYSKTIKGYK